MPLLPCPIPLSKKQPKEHFVKREKKYYFVLLFNRQVNRNMKSDIEIARETSLVKVKEIAENIGIARQEVQNYGRYIAKISLHLIDEEQVQKSNLILVTAITPTKAGIGKTTVSIGLALGLNKIGKKSNRSIAGTLFRSLFWDERRSCRRRLFPGVTHGKYQPPFHRRLSCRDFRP